MLAHPTKVSRIKSHVHDDEGRLDTAFKDSEQKPNNHQTGKVLGGGRAGNDHAPAEDVDREILGDRELLQQHVGRILSHQDAHVEDGAEPAAVMSEHLTLAFLAG